MAVTPTARTATTRTSTFGPSALATPANAITIARVALTPALLFLVLRDGATWGSFALWTLVAGTDGVDGFVARRQGATRSGAFLDPLADKLLVLGAMSALVSIDVLWVVPVAVLAVREIAMSAYRSYVARRGISIPARPMAKAKTFVQSFAVGFALAPTTSQDVRWLANTLLWVSVVLAMVSFAQYVGDGRRARAG